MKKTFNKIKTSIATLWVVIISFFSKVLWEFWQETLYDIHWNPTYFEVLYGVWYPYDVPSPETSTLIDVVIKISKRPLIGITFIVWIISFIKIRKIEDKAQKKKKIKRAIIAISILVVLIVVCLLLPLFLKK